MIKKKTIYIHKYINIVFVTFFLNLFLSICYMCYLYSKLRAFFKREKTSPKELEGVIFFIYSIYIDIHTLSFVIYTQIFIKYR